MKHLKLLQCAFVIASIFVVSGCYPSGPDYVEDLDVIYTTYDEDYDFQAQGTYAMPDQIVIDVDVNAFGDTSFVYMKSIYAQPILAAIDNNMEGYGWTKVGLGSNPDVLIMPAALSNTTYFYSWWYCWWWGGWYSYWWDWYYPPYYPVSSITTGSMIIVMTDPNLGQDTPSGLSSAAWIGIGNGVLTDYNDTGRAVDAVDQSFEQSPYLNIQ